MPVRIGEGFATVLLAAQRDAPWAYERLYHSLAPAVLGYLRLQGAVDAEDLTSEVFLGVFRGLPVFRGDEDKFRAWVFVIAHRRLIDERRRMRCRPQVSGGGLDDVDEAGGDVEDDVFVRLSEARVRQLCEDLSSEQRDVLLLRLVAAMTVEQVAESLNKTEGAVKALQRRGIATLRHRLARLAWPDCDGPGAYPSEPVLR